MNSPIKFRVWNDNYNQWSSNQNIQILGNGNITIQSFTGLLDKNGKEIYQGDIVKYTYKMDEHGELETSSAIIVYDTASACFCFRFINSDYEEYIHEVKSLPGFSMEVIGNVFENPELFSSSKL